MVTAAELVRNFAAIRHRAMSAPVVVTNHGKQSHVLCSAEQFEMLSRRSSAGEGPVALELAQLAAWIDQGLILIDEIGRILHANAALLAIAPHHSARIVGRPVLDAMPEWCGTLAEAYLRRAIGSRETALFEMASPFVNGAWLQCRLAPVGGGFALLIRDATREIREVRGAGARDAFTRALDFNAGVSAVRLSVRGTIEAAHANFAALLGFAEGRLAGLQFCDLVNAPDRVSVRDAIESVLGQGEGRAIAARLVTRSGALVQVQIGAVRAGFGETDGAALVISGHDSTAPREFVPTHGLNGMKVTPGNAKNVQIIM